MAGPYFRRSVVGPVGPVADGHLVVFDGVTGFVVRDGGPPAAGGGGPHTHPQSEIVGLEADLDAIDVALVGKAASVHGHAIGDVTGLQAALDGKAASSHTQAISTITGLQGALDAKAASGHDHAGVYEPANANIQTHIAAAHAPANAQKNSDITKAEIEAKLTGEITTHTHPASGGADPFTKFVLASAVSTGANTTPVTVTGLVFPFVANGKYAVEIFGTLQAPAATTGAGLQLDTSVAVTRVSLNFFHQLANTGTVTGGSSIADDASVGVSSGVPSANVAVPFYACGTLIAGANGGNAQLRLRSEVNAVVTLNADTLMRVMRMT